MSNVQYVGKHMDLESVAEIRNVKDLTLSNAATNEKHPVRKAEFDVEVQQLNALAAQKGQEAKDYADTKITELVGGASGAFDTLKEIQDSLGSDPDLKATITSLTTANAAAIAQKVSNEVHENITFTNNSGVFSAEQAHGFNTAHISVRLRYLDNLEWRDLDDDGVSVTYTDSVVKIQTLSPTIGAMTLAAIVSGVPVAV